MAEFPYFPPSEPQTGEILPRDSLILVTGASGLLGSHVVDQCLAAGFKVRGTTRDKQKNAWLERLFEDKYGSTRYETVEVKDMAVAGAYDAAVQGCAGVVHVATNMTFSADVKEVISSAVTGAMNTIRAAASTSTVRRFVYTSSSTAAWGPRWDEEVTLTEESWNEEDVKNVCGSSPQGPYLPMKVYGASKVKTEQALWKFMAEERPAFTLTTVLPETLLGRIFDESLATRLLSASFPRIIYAGRIDEIKDIQPPRQFTPLPSCAALHVAGLLLPDTAGERIFAHAEPWNFNRMLGTLRKLFPSKMLHFGPDIEGLGQDLAIVPKDRTIDILKRINTLIHGSPDGFVSWEECVRECMIGMPGIEDSDATTYSPTTTMLAWPKASRG